MTEIHPGSEIPIFVPSIPSEQGADTPVTRENSVFANVPEMNLVVDELFDYTKASSKAKEGIIRGVVNRLVSNPERMADYFDALWYFADLKSYKKDDFEEALERALSQMRLPREAVVLEKWLALYAENPLYAPLVENILEANFDKCQDEVSLINFLYEFALAGLTSSNVAVRNLVFDVFAYKTKIFKAGSPQAMNYILSVYSLNDEVLRKAMEVDSAFYSTAPTLRPNAMEEREKFDDIIRENPEYARRMAQTATADQERFGALFEFYDRDEDHGVISIKAKKHTDFPLNLLAKAGPLRLWLNQYLSEEIEAMTGQKTYKLSLPNGVLIMTGSHKDIIEDIRLSLGQECKIEHLTDTEQWRTLAYLSPETLDNDAEKLRALEELNQALVGEMQDSTRYSLSPRGDMLEIVDEEVKKLGFKKILYQMDAKDRRKTVVTVFVDNFSYQLVLDQHYALKNVKDDSSITLPNTGEFLRGLILSHLREIKCSETVNEVGGEKDTGADRRKAFISRRGHVRVLQPGQKPHDLQVGLAMEHGVPLLEVNRRFQMTPGETRWKTFVSPTASAIPGQGPVVSRAPEATNKIQHIINE